MSDSHCCFAQKNYMKGCSSASSSSLCSYCSLSGWRGKVGDAISGEYLQKSIRFSCPKLPHQSLNPFLSRLSVENLGLEKEGICSMSPVCNSPGCWLTCSGKKWCWMEAHMMVCICTLIWSIGALQAFSCLPPRPMNPSKRKRTPGPLAWQVLLPRLTHSNAQFDLGTFTGKGKVCTETPDHRLV